MSYTAIGRKKVYASIEDLPENQKLVNGDRLLLQTEDGTALVDYENVKIDLQHTTFGDQFRNLVELSSTVESFSQTLNEEIESINEKISDLENSSNAIKNSLGITSSDNSSSTYTSRAVAGLTVADEFASVHNDIDGISDDLKTLNTTVSSFEETITGVKSLQYAWEEKMLNNETKLQEIDADNTSLSNLYQTLYEEIYKNEETGLYDEDSRIDKLSSDIKKIKNDIEDIKKRLSSLESPEE